MTSLLLLLVSGLLGAAVAGAVAAGWLRRRTSTARTDAAATDDVGASGREAAEASEDAVAGEPQGEVPRLADVLTDSTRRGLVLVHRVIERVDALQQVEGDPARLAQLYDVDHLLVQLRRRSQNLLVVADEALAGEPDEPSMRLLDLVRLAASETADFRRVQPAVALPTEVKGWLSRPLALLIAALLDNAQAYSPPTSVVQVAAGPADDGVSLTIRDHGIGMDTAGLAWANELLADPPALEQVGSRQLGFLVCAKIARRLGVTVSLAAAADGPGLVATVALPASVLAAAAPDRSVVSGVTPASLLPPAAVAEPPTSSRAALVRELAAMDDPRPEPARSPATGGVPAPAARPADAPPVHEPAPPLPVADATPTPTEVDVVVRDTRPQGGWSTALPARQVRGSGPTTAFVSSPDRMRTGAPAAADGPLNPVPTLPIVAPSLGTAPRFSPAVDPARSPDVIAREPDDFVPEVVDNPLLDLLPDDPSSHVASLLLAPAPVGAPTPAPVAPLLDGIQLAGGEGNVEPAGLPARSPARERPTTNVTKLFADMGFGDDTGGEAGDDVDALSDLTAGER